LYGFDNKRITCEDGKKKSVLVINENEKKVVEMIYELYLHDNSSIRSVVAKLNLQNIKPRKR